MRLCCSTASYRRAIESRELTQLEWIDRCARDLAVDGIEFDAGFFPRTDDDYLAQLKKLCADRCLTVAGATAIASLGGDDVEAAIESFVPWIDRALALGAPLLRFECGGASGAPGIGWREFVRALKHVCAEAKRRNVTLALQAGASGSLVITPADVRRALKECDSAWLRLAMRAADLRADASGEWRELMDETVIATTETGDPSEIAALGNAGYRGFVSLCFAGERDEAEAVPAIIKSMRL
ncbi:MAG TPA: TIM barrel protein [Candidatus Eremiobacteraceae bacterium]